MSGVIAVGAALAATAIAVEVGTTFAIIAAVGATIGAVGALTGVKELAIAGSVLGAVGGIGSLASSAGLFSGAGFGAELAGAAGGGAESFLGTVGQAADEVSSFANVTAQLAPAGGYTTEMLATSGLAGAEGLPGSSLFSSLSGTEAALSSQSIDIVDMVNGVSETNFNPLPITEGTQTPSTIPEVLPETTINPVEPPTQAPLDPAGEFPNMYQQGAEPAGQIMVDNGTTPQGLIESAAAPQDQFGNVIAQGGDPTGAQIGPGVSNPAQVIDPAAAAAPATAPAPIDPAAATTATTASPATAGAAPAATAAADAGATTQAISGTVTGNSVGASAAGTAAGNPADPSIWSTILDFTKKNQGLTMGGISAVGSFLSGAMSPLNPAQVKKLEAEAASNQAAANLAKAQEELLRRRLQNMSGLPPTATRREPTPIGGGAPAGLINSGGGAGAAVTGRPA